jgi:hypothetical protein
MTVQTSGDGEMFVAPIMIRNDPDDTSTDAKTTNRPTLRMARWPAALISGRPVVATGTTSGTPIALSLVSAVSFMSQQLVSGGIAS